MHAISNAETAKIFIESILSTTSDDVHNSYRLNIRHQSTLAEQVNLLVQAEQLNFPARHAPTRHVLRNDATVLARVAIINDLERNLDFV